MVQCLCVSMMENKVGALKVYKAVYAHNKAKEYKKVQALILVRNFIIHSVFLMRGDHLHKVCVGAYTPLLYNVAYSHLLLKNLCYF